MYEYHRFAGVFEFMEGQEFEDLVKSITEIGQKQPIYRYEGKILDGRNRYRACLAAGVEPEFKTFVGTDEQALDFVWQMNVDRRHLDSSQMAVSLVKRHMLVSELKAAAAERAEEGKKATQIQPGNDRRDERGRIVRLSQFVDSTGVQPATPSEPDTILDQPRPTPSPLAVALVKTATAERTPPTRPVGPSAQPRKDPNAGKVAQQLADMAPGLTNRTYVQEVLKIVDEKGIDSPEIKELATRVKNVPEKIRERKEEKREAIREADRQLVKQAPALVTLEEGKKYSTLLLDPPWDWGDEGDVDQMGRARPTYATMTIDQIANEPVGELADKNAHIYLWITNRSLPKGFALLEKWGFRYITTITWVKPSFGMGNYFRGSTEQILFGVRGSLAGVLLCAEERSNPSKLLWSRVLEVPRSGDKITAHSRKAWGWRVEYDRTVLNGYAKDQLYGGVLIGRHGLAAVRCHVSSSHPWSSDSCLEAARNHESRNHRSTGIRSRIPEGPLPAV